MTSSLVTVLACFCQSRVVHPATAGHAAAWPLLLLWGGQALAAAGVVAYLARRRWRRRAQNQVSTPPSTSYASSTR